ncbi:N-acetyltransferase family protein [Veillonella sp.]|uniref:GNAT family N-acetyltransferase n=1 Tax=Veillonella sp. TaxID=1926307 RepID=UPI00290D49AC|nr:N-acetyltransferase family protein [Veillonella sp.]MDU7498013.1 GNAT family N-acetyltransferase [Veillonella sp.]
MSELVIQSITKNDIFACLAIYNYEVINGVATLDLEPRTLEEWHEWYNAHSDEHHPILVGTIDDVVVGYASLSPYRLKDAFKSTVELSIYIHKDYRGQGVATQLMERILEMAKEDTMLHNVVSVITAGNEESTKLHNRFGFTYCGLTPEVGFKHGKYQDTETYALLV